MLVYNYHSEFKYFVGSEEALLSPLETGIYLIPANATPIQPTEAQTGSIAVFKNGEWSVIADLRGDCYSTTTREQIYNSDPRAIPTGFTSIKPPEITRQQFLTWNNEWVVNKYSEPSALTPEQKLTNAGLSITELKALLGLT